MVRSFDRPSTRWGRLRRATSVALLLHGLLQGGLAAAAPADLADFQRTPNLSLMAGPGLADAVQDLYLEVVLNGVVTHRVVHFPMTADGRFHAWPQNLLDLGFRLDDVDRSQYLDIAQLPGIRYQYDTLNQRMLLSGDDNALDLKLQAIQTRTMSVREAVSGVGAVLNYDAYAVEDDSRTSLNLATGLRVFSDFGVLENTGLSYLGDAPGDGYVRLDTTWSLSSQDALSTLNAGDLVGGSLPWTRATRLGGIQLRRNFRLDPRLVTYPLPQFFGQAALPSEIELYVDGQRQYDGNVLPGPFRIDALPGISGAGVATLVMTDALGRTTTLSFDYYNAQQLLRAGFTDYSVEAGVLRRAYAQDSFSYGDAAALASVRHGLTDWLTLEGHAEGGDGVQLLGAGAVASAGAVGTVSAAWAGSSGGPDADRGAQYALDYAWTGAGFHAGLGSARTQGRFRDVASLEGRPPPLRSERAILGYGAGRLGSLSLFYTRLDTTEQPRFRSAGVSYGVAPFERLSLYLGAHRNLDDTDDLRAYVGLSYVFAPRISASVSADFQRDGDGYSAQVTRTAPVDGGLGWHAQVRRSDRSDSMQAELRYLSDWGESSAGVWSMDDSTRPYAGLRGAAIFMDRALFAARHVRDSFALVSTNGIPGVPVLHENRPMGSTDSNGHFLLSDLSAYEENRVSIDPLMLPGHISVGAVQQQVMPTDRAGVLVRFDLREQRAALLALRDAAGAPVPLGSRIFHVDDPALTPEIVGFDGEAYIENLRTLNRLRVVTPSGASCELRIDMPARPSIEILGPLQCPLH